LLFYYTTADGLLAALETQRVPAPNALFLKSRSELEGSAAVIKEVLHEFIVGTTRPMAEVLTLAGELCEYPATTNSLYVTRLFAGPDVQSQWNEASNDGSGYAVGLEAAALAWRLEGEPDYRIAAVEYEPESQRAVIRHTLSTACEAITQSLNGIGPSGE